MALFFYRPHSLVGYQELRSYRLYLYLLLSNYVTTRLKDGALTTRGAILALFKRTGRCLGLQFEPHCGSIYLVCGVSVITAYHKSIQIAVCSLDTTNCVTPLCLNTGIPRYRDISKPEPLRLIGMFTKMSQKVTALQKNFLS
jgi:hypothetical protein